MRSIRLHFAFDGDEPTKTAFVATLAEAGLTSVALDAADRRTPAVVFFHQIDSELYDLVRTLSANGLDRVLTVASSRAALGDGGSFRLLGAGASEVIVWKPGGATGLQVAARIDRWSTIDAVALSPLVQENFVGKSRASTVALRQLIEIAKFTEASALILGESGTGKELAARLIHTLDSRPVKGDLVIVDCTTVVPELSGSEFFGHERGAFTGAAGARDGAFALADGGTLFLDEIGELPLGLQAQLLRVVQERTYKRVGGNTWQKTHFRLVCATNRDLLHEVETGAFRRDLYYRIASTVTRLPSLRDRPEDILPLARHFIESLLPDEAAPPLDDDVRDHLLRRSYPGNVRELRQLVSRVLHRYVAPGPVTVGALPDDERGADIADDSWRDGVFDDVVRRALTFGARLKDIRRTAEDAAVRIAVEDEEGNLQRAAVRLGVTDRALQLRRASQRQSDDCAALPEA